MRESLRVQEEEEYECNSGKLCGARRLHTGGKEPNVHMCLQIVFRFCVHWYNQQTQRVCLIPSELSLTSGDLDSCLPSIMGTQGERNPTSTCVSANSLSLMCTSIIGKQERKGSRPAISGTQGNPMSTCVCVIYPSEFTQ